MFSPSSSLCSCISMGTLPRQFGATVLRMIVCLCVVSSASRITYSSEKMTEVEAKKERYACGARSAFALIRLLGKDATYSTVSDHFTFSENGNSLADVRNALLAHNVDCSIRRLQLTDLSSTPLPFIGHLAKVREGSFDDGHFLIVTGVDEVGVQTYEPMLNKTSRLPWRVFSDRWYGYVILPTQATNWSSHLMTNVVGIHFLMFFLVVVSLGRKMWPLLIKKSTAVRLFITVFIVSALGLSHLADAAASELLRSNLNGGANAAALLGGLYSVEIPPGHVEGTASIESLRDIELRLQAHGLHTSVRFLGYDALVSCNRPCVVPMTAAGTTINAEGASFYIFLQAIDSEVYLAAAGPLTVRTVSVDDFRRYWTGYAVFCDAADAHQRDLLVWALFGLGVPLSGYGVFVCLRSVGRRLRLAARAT